MKDKTKNLTKKEDDRRRMRNWVIMTAGFFAFIVAGVGLMTTLDEHRERVIASLGGDEKLFQFLEELLAGAFAFITLLGVWFLLVPPAITVIAIIIGKSARGTEYMKKHFPDTKQK
ncbi:MAG TPA: hypothetical protein QF873_01930 [Patescibacteria group bacterium]|nr:hypothetical protein [Patescibacteria group bacterium]